MILVSGLQPRGSLDHVYVGADRCRLCHRRIYQSWVRTAHERATESIAERDRADECLPCHTTGPEALPGVQCEACHGPGGNYWPAEIMIDPGKAREAGLVQPTEPVCRGCHGRGASGHSSRFSMPSKEELRRIVHGR